MKYSRKTVHELYHRTVFAVSPSMRRFVLQCGGMVFTIAQDEKNDSKMSTFDHCNNITE